MASEYDPEKRAGTVEKAASLSSSDDVDAQVQQSEGIYAREELLDPAKEDTLQRGLSARQIQMIAVRPLSSVYMCSGGERLIEECTSSLAARSVQALSSVRVPRSYVEGRLAFSSGTVLSGWCATWLWSPSER